MGSVTTSDGAEIFYKDWGQGQPVVLSHGWPLSSDSWDPQMLSSPATIPLRRPRPPRARTLEVRP
jgi:pimeloyl-ACP methyl ester carboxylesterase